MNYPSESLADFDFFITEKLNAILQEGCDTSHFFDPSYQIKHLVGAKNFLLELRLAISKDIVNICLSVALYDLCDNCRTKRANISDEKINLLNCFLHRCVIEYLFGVDQLISMVSKKLPTNNTLQ